MANIYDLPAGKTRLRAARWRQVHPGEDGGNPIWISEVDYVGTRAELETGLNLQDYFTYKHPDDANYFLVEVSDLRPLAGNRYVQTWTYGKSPPTFNTWESAVYTFPGLDAIFGTPGSLSVVGSGILVWTISKLGAREPLTLVVPVRVQHDFIVLNDEESKDWINPGVGGTVTTAGDIPLLQPFTVIDEDGRRVDICRDSTGATGAATTPSATDYRGYMEAGDEIPIQESTIERYMGNIYVRRTPFAVAR